MFKKICVVCIIIVYGCQDKNNFTPVLNIPAEFQPCVDSFVAAAAQRGHSIIINNLIIKYDSSLSNIYCANSNVTSSQNDIQKIISVNPNIKCWQNSKQLETLIFHEMGHCIWAGNMINLFYQTVSQKVLCTQVILRFMHHAHTL
jgi:hypothetical protein